MNKSFSRVLITGTTSGLGRTLSEHYRKQNIEVIAINRRKTEEPGNIVIDITDPNQVTNYLQQLKLDQRLPDLLILNAGINQPDNVGPLNLDKFCTIWNTNFMGVVNFVAALQNLKIQNRTIVTFSSTSNIVPNPGHLGYFLSKLALHETFKLFRISDPTNHYQSVILSPIHTNIMNDYPSPKGLQGKIFNLLAITTEKAAPKLVAFFESDRQVFYFTKTACAFYFSVRILLRFLPRIYKGTVAVPTAPRSLTPHALPSPECD